MAGGITLQKAEAQLALYLAAEEAILNNQSYTINGRSLSRADLGRVQEGVAIWDRRVQRLSTSRRTLRYARPVSS